MEEKKKHKQSSILGICSWILLALFVLSLIPIVAVGSFDRMFSDDYDYSVETRRAWAAQENLPSLLRAAADTVEETYKTWQGTYSAVFLFSLQPAVFSQGLYALTPILLIASLAIGIAVSCYSVCKYLLGLDRRAWLIAFAFACILCVQFPRDACEGFFWYNAGMFYTFFFGLFLLWLGIALQIVLRNKISRGGYLLKTSVLIALAGIIAGGNYPTALLLGIALALLLAWSIWRNKRTILPFLLVLVVYGTGFAVSIIAPGNEVRQALLQRQTPLEAIYHAILGTPIRLIGQLLRHPGVPALLLLVWTPLCFVFVRHSSARFRYPLLPVIGSFLVLAALFTPSYYAMSSAGPYRLWNVVMFCFYLLMMGNLYYLAGWFKQRLPNIYSKLLLLMDRLRRFAPAYILIVVSASVLLSGVGPSLGIERESPTSVRAAEGLSCGCARAYASAFDAQIAQITSTNGEAATIDPIPEPSSILPDGDVTRYLKISGEPCEWFGCSLLCTEELDFSGD